MRSRRITQARPVVFSVLPWAGISETNLPAELMADFTTLEYRLSSPPAAPPVFLFVVDAGATSCRCRSLTFLSNPACRRAGGDEVISSSRYRVAAADCLCWAHHIRAKRSHAARSPSSLLQ